MSHLDNINNFIQDLNVDKSIPQPEKNYLLSDAKRIRMALIGATNMSLAKPPEDVPGMNRFPTPTASQCICQPDMPARKDCPVHGV